MNGWMDCTEYVWMVEPVLGRLYFVDPIHLIWNLESGI